ncbi:SAM-dependent chlorinase/fluorinase [Cytophagales bacterium LB-30]|uniref:SAM-dependent chlorinase/fluorinase n=1 Tax=Shiella aurantiaca TaxID=3058365 RepID=A0ABT8F7V0_9BACT|nr:SAM-dependent chlorinase/fluorinase [Shiella aurantiaca]MDN4166530.1 SAM-dependent chlorinase/fluorinase [Shiella aurantiaca]
MALITLLTDFGYTDHYVAAVKAKLLHLAPSVQVMDISHGIEHHNLIHAAYVLQSVYRDFPKGTIHLVAVGAQETPIAFEANGYWFVGSNNGLLSLIPEKTPEKIGRIVTALDGPIRFMAKEILAPAAAQLAMGTPVEQITEAFTDFKQFMGRSARATRKQMAGNVIHIDHYGNLITNLMEQDFTILSKGRKYQVLFSREQLNKVNDTYQQIEPGDCGVLFNSLGQLTILIKEGNAAQLLGLGIDSSVQINFEDL